MGKWNDLLTKVSSPKNFQAFLEKAITTNDILEYLEKLPSESISPAESQQLLFELLTTACEKSDDATLKLLLIYPFDRKLGLKGMHELIVNRGLELLRDYNINNNQWIVIALCNYFVFNKIEVDFSPLLENLWEKKWAHQKSALQNIFLPVGHEEMAQNQLACITVIILAREILANNLSTVLQTLQKDFETSATQHKAPGAVWRVDMDEALINRGFLDDAYRSITAPIESYKPLGGVEKMGISSPPTDKKPPPKDEGCSIS